MARLILLIEDNAANQILFRAVLERAGYEIAIAGSAAEARQSLKGRMPDLILMDVQLPGQDGLSLARQLKSDSDTAAIPIVALTARAMQGDREKALAAGCAAYVAKPVDTRELRAQIAAVLQRP